MAYPFRDGEPPRRIMWATWALIIACLVTFAFMQPKPMQGAIAGTNIESFSRARLQVREFLDAHALVPCEVTHGRSINAGAACSGYPSDTPEQYAPKNPYVPLVGALFLHGSILHLLGNMLFLWLFGRGVEERIGSAGVLALFIAGGVAANLAYVGLHPESTEPLLGASGAVAALMGAYLVLQPRRRILAMVYSAGLQFVYLPAWSVLAFFFIEQFFIDPTERVAWEAHVAGMLFGVLVAGVVAWRDPRSRSDTPRPTSRVESGLPLPLATTWPSLPSAPPS